MKLLRGNIGLILQIVIVITVLLLPLAYTKPQHPLTLRSYLLRASQLLAMLMVYYVNYLWLVPRLLRGNKMLFFIVNIILISLLSICVHDSIRLLWHQEFDIPIPEKWSPHPIFIFREMFNMSVAAAIATAVTQSRRWAIAEKELNEAKAAQAEAELQNLRWQINPHFVLNTLNNIYALTEQDKKKSQTAILELSRMLNYILYDNKLKWVALQDEVDFIHNYIALMRLRTATPVTEHYDIAGAAGIQVPPMLFISLVENAFKHGISTSKESFIEINITGNAQAVVCLIRNSYHPKSANDQSGHGIGLENVAKRLALVYPDRHEWQKGIITEDNKSIYFSKITIYDTQLHNH